MRRPLVLLLACLVGTLGAQSRSAAPRPAGIRLADLTWLEAAKILDSNTVVVVPLGAEAKEHGPHLKLKNDWLLAEYYARRLIATERIVLAPTVNYSFYPAFVEYAGSTSLRLETARDMIIDICSSFARFGVRRCYILNTGVSTVRALTPARDSLAARGIVMRFSDVGKLGRATEDSIRQQAGGTHADEIETSMMLYMFPETVNMRLAADDYHPGTGGLTVDSARAVREGKTWSRTGIFGNATLATREKGRRVVEASIRGLRAEIAALRAAPLP
ncbi:MAG: creatininase family protein [Gemmatimonadaceae bacterium]|nr:creatininase family protein [Gemmatimonadaceae bacterium]